LSAALDTRWVELASPPPDDERVLLEDEGESRGELFHDVVALQRFDRALVELFDTDRRAGRASGGEGSFDLKDLEATAPASDPDLACSAGDLLCHGGPTHYPTTSATFATNFGRWITRMSIRMQHLGLAPLRRGRAGSR